MNTPSRNTSSDPATDDPMRLGNRVLGVVAALAAAAALASLLSFRTADAVPVRADTQPAQADAMSGTAGAPLLHDHSVVLTQDLPDDTLAPGASIATYSAP
jgi:hypothetical protein